MSAGLLIAIESNSDTTAVVQRLRQRLSESGYQVSILDFPRLDAESSHFIRQAHAGEYAHTSAYTDALFYALDHYEHVGQLRKELDDDKVVIVTGYTGSNMAVRGAAFSHAEERRGFFVWLDNLSSQILGLPRPTKIYVLRQPPRPDEDNQRITDAYDDLCQLFPQDFYRLELARGGHSLSHEAVDDLLWGSLEAYLPVTPPATVKQTTASPDYEALAQKDASGAYQYFVPEQLDDELQQRYRQTMDTIFDHYAAIGDALGDFTIARAVLPVAAVDASLPTAPDAGPLAEASVALPDNHAEGGTSVKLHHVWPRNELELLPLLLYRHSNQPLAELEDIVSSWPIDRKQGLLPVLYDQDAEARQLATYTWDVCTEYQYLQEAAAAANVQLQTLTPRYGYAMPEAIETAGLAEQYEACFDLSLQLHSHLQAAGYAHEAQFATLLGHRQRALLQCNGDTLVYVLAAMPNPVAEHMQQQLQERHPLTTA